MNDECIGISEGSFRLDSSGYPDTQDMKQASIDFRSGDKSTAKGLWLKATPGDAEPLVYHENLDAVNSDTPHYFDIVVVTMLSGNQESINVGQNELRGFFLALKQYDYLPTNIPVRFLLANIGNDSKYAGQVEYQIEQLAQQDSHLIGILGWPTSINEHVITSIKKLGFTTSLPIISPTASADELSHLNPFFFRMIPPNQKWAEAQVSLVQTAFASANPGAKRAIKIAILISNAQDGQRNPYSQSLGKDFKDVLTKEQIPHQIVLDRVYNHLDTSQINTLVEQALAKQADILYVPGLSEDAEIILKEINTQGDTHMKVVGGDGLAHTQNYPFSGYPISADGRLYYTSFALPPTQCENNSQNEFFPDYFQTFQLCPDNDAMLAFDSAQTMFYAITKAVEDKGKNITSEDVWAVLNQIDDLHPLSQGIVTGNVTFDNGDRTDPIVESFMVQNGKVYPIS